MHGIGNARLFSSLSLSLLARAFSYFRSVRMNHIRNMNLRLVNFLFARVDRSSGDDEAKRNLRIIITIVARISRRKTLLSKYIQ